MAGKHSSAAGTASENNDLGAVLDRVTQSLERITATIDALATRLGLPAESCGGMPSPAAAIPAGLFEALPMDATLAEISGGGPAEGTAAATPPAAAAAVGGLADTVSSPPDDAPDLRSSPQDGLASLEMLSAAAAVPSQGLAPLQNLSQDAATSTSQAEQIEIAREQLAEQKRTNDFLEKQSDGQPATYGP